MARIYKRSDRIAVKIDDITVKLAPLSLDQKTEIQQAMVEGRSKGDVKELTRGIALSIGYALKGVEGLEDGDGQPYKLEFDGEKLASSCVDDLMNLEITPRLILVCAQMANGVPNKFTDENKKALKGVELVETAKDSSPKK